MMKYSSCFMLCKSKHNSYFTGMLRHSTCMLVASCLVFFVFIDQGADLEFLMAANDHELLTLVPGIINKGKLRMALDQLKESKNKDRNSVVGTKSNELFVATPQRTAIITSSLVTPPVWELQNTQENCSTLNTEPVSQAALVASPSILTWDPQISEEWGVDYEEALASIEITTLTKNPSLKSILEKTSIGKPLLSKQILTTRDRKVLTALIVEAEVRKLKKVTDPIRKEAWDKWTSEITTLFPTEAKAVYYSPFRLIDGRAIQASGLIVNRLITVRRKLAPHHRRSSSVSSENSSSSGGKKRKTDTESQTRVRPLPESFSLKNISNQSTAKENLQWLKFSSSPRDLVDTKWKDCLRERLMVLQEGGHLNYFLEFPALQCPWGYELLASDFENICPDAKGKFEEKFPIIKGRLLTLLDEKSQELTRADTTIQTVLDLATCGEEQANVAAFLAIPLLLKQMHTIPVKGVRKPWHPSRSEVSNAFLSLVPSTSDLDKHYCDWEAKLKEKKIPLLPHIVAVGACWESIEQYDLIISKEVRYTFQNVCDAVTNTFKILWALDLPYSKDCVPIWMFIQRSIYMVKSKYDTEGTPMLDLLISVSNRHDGAVCNM
ncbi:hypothetical protein ACJJTC_009281 [Scirpophaga incertulas]